MPGIPIGVRIAYEDGSVVRLDPKTLGAWELSRATGIQCVTVYFDATYKIWQQDGYDEQGKAINQRLETENYIHMFHGTRGGEIELGTGAVTQREGAPCDYYWLDLARGKIGAGILTDVPEGLRAGLIKTVTLLPDDSYYTIMNAAHQERKWT